MQLLDYLSKHNMIYKSKLSYKHKNKSMNKYMFSME